MSTGEILHGGGGNPLFGKNGTILYAVPCTMSVSIVISWSGGKDVDICACYNVVPGTIGFSHDSKIEENGFLAEWTSGDNTTGGPETIRLSYSGERSSLANVHFDVHANWYSVGSDSNGNALTGGGPATVTATDANGTSLSYTIMPSSALHRAANIGDPGVRINFNANGTLKSITSC